MQLCNPARHRHECGAEHCEGEFTLLRDAHGGGATFNGTRRVVPRLSFRELEAQLGWRIDTLLIDCEACITSFLSPSDAGEILSGIRLVLIEHDLPQEVGNGGYGAYFELFRKHGFEQIWLAQDTWSTATWSRLLQHSAWIKVNGHDPSTLATLRRSCWEYAERRGYPQVGTPKSGKLRCLDPSRDDLVGWRINAANHSGLNDQAVWNAFKERLASGKVAQAPPGCRDKRIACDVRLIFNTALRSIGPSRSHRARASPSLSSCGRHSFSGSGSVFTSSRHDWYCRFQRLHCASRKNRSCSPASMHASIAAAPPHCTASIPCRLSRHCARIMRCQQQIALENIRLHAHIAVRGDRGRAGVRVVEGLAQGVRTPAATTSFVAAVHTLWAAIVLPITSVHIITCANADATQDAAEEPYRRRAVGHRRFTRKARV